MKNLLSVVAALLVFTAVGGYLFYDNEYMPIVRAGDKIDKEIENQKKIKRDLEGVDKELVELRDELAKLTEDRSKKKTEFNQLSTVVPKLLASTEIIANKFKVKFQDIRISPLIKNDEYSELPVELIVQGTFQDVGSFLKIMEARKIINLAGGQISVNVTSGDAKGKSKGPNLNVTLSANVCIMENI